jgi:hypothetical protein
MAILLEARDCPMPPAVVEEFSRFAGARARIPTMKRRLGRALAIGIVATLLGATGFVVERRRESFRKPVVTITGTTGNPRVAFVDEHVLATFELDLTTFESDTKMRLWSAETGAPLGERAFPLEGETFEGIACGRIATRREGECAHVWSLETGKLVSTIAPVTSPEAAVCTFNLSRSGRLCSLGLRAIPDVAHPEPSDVRVRRPIRYGGEVRSTRDATLVVALEPITHQDNIDLWLTGVLFSLEEDRAVGLLQDELVVWSLADGRVRRRFAIEKPTIWLGVTCADELLCLGLHETVAVPLDEGRPVRTLARDPFFPLALSPSGEKLAALDPDEMLCFVDVATGAVLSTTPRKGRPNSATFSPSGDQLALYDITDYEKGLWTVEVWKVPP